MRRNAERRLPPAYSNSKLLESLALCEANHNPPELLASVARNLGLLALHQADYKQACVYLRRALVLRGEIGGQYAIVEVLAYCAWLALRLGRPDGTLRLIGATVTQKARLGDVAPPLDPTHIEEISDAARQQLSAEAAAAAWAAGAAMSLEAAVTYALETALAE